ncbi:MAG: GDP-mannose 4,6-dehydratase [Acholeplasmataceae bacterium]
MKVLIIGGSGFVGYYMYNQLNRKNNYIIAVTKLQNEKLNYQPDMVFDLNILNIEMIEKVLSEFQPNLIFHLAAQSSVSISWSRPALTFDINVIGTINLLESIRKTNLSTRIILIGSSEEYGNINQNDLPIVESTIPQPLNIYGISKYSQNMIAKLYVEAYNLDIVMTRSFNHIGPMQLSNFVIPSFCKQIASLEMDKNSTKLYVGNLNVRRDFTDVRDVVKAYELIAIKGIKGETYNVCSGKSYLLKDLLEFLVSKSSKNIEVIIDPNKYRPIDVYDYFGSSVLLEQLGWSTEYTIQETLLDTLNYWRLKELGD